jgi:coproporphyrinogen III oxidase-like Fe-S oxidoreductase
MNLVWRYIRTRLLFINYRFYERWGFDRVSIGVQDIDEEILKVINRFQTVEQIEMLTIAAREMGIDQ